jgi:hypothetical protein
MYNVEEKKIMKMSREGGARECGIQFDGRAERRETQDKGCCIKIGASATARKDKLGTMGNSYTMDMCNSSWRRVGGVGASS